MFELSSCGLYAVRMLDPLLLDLSIVSYVTPLSYSIRAFPFAWFLEKVQIIWGVRSVVL